MEPASLLWTWQGREDREDGERQRLWARVEQKGSFGSSRDWGGEVRPVLGTEKNILLNLAGGQLGPVFTLMIWVYTGVMQGGKRVAEERTEVKGEGPVCGKREGSGMLEKK